MNFENENEREMNEEEMGGSEEIQPNNASSTVSTISLSDDDYSSNGASNVEPNSKAEESSRKKLIRDANNDNLKSLSKLQKLREASKKRIAKQKKQNRTLKRKLLLLKAEKYLRDLISTCEGHSRP